MFLGFLAKSILIGDYVIDFFKTFLMTVFLSYSSLDWPELSQKYNCRSLDPPICALL